MKLAEPAPPGGTTRAVSCRGTLAAVSISSQRGSMVGPGRAMGSCCSDAVSAGGMTSLGSMATSRS